MAVVYHWKHGWIPLTHEAALSKAKGNHEAAARMMGDAHHSPGIQSRQDVAKAVLDVKNLPSHEQHNAMAQIRVAAAQHGAEDLLPHVGGNHRTSAELAAAADAKRAEFLRIADSAGWGDRAAGRLSPKGLAQAHRGTDSALRRATEAKQAASALDSQAAQQAHREAEAARQHFTAAELKGATHVRDSHGWHEVVRVNGKTVTVKTPYSWTDAIKHEKILQAAKPGSEPGKRHIHGPGGS